MKKKPNGYRYFYHLTGCLFGIFILAVLIINFLVPDRGFSQKENRVLASRPAISVSQLTSGKFADGYETYVNDQFFLRDWWITLRATAQRILGNTEENGVFLGKSGYLMEDFTAPSQERLNRTVNAMTDFAARHSDLPQYALIAPNAVNILSDKLPALAAATDQNPYLDATAAALEKAGVTFVMCVTPFPSTRMTEFITTQTTTGLLRELTSLICSLQRYLELILLPSPTTSSRFP